MPLVDIADRGTIFASTHLPLRLWFRAIYQLTQTKQGISSIELGRRLGVTQTTAWKIKHKLKQVMLERDATKRLSGRIEIDDAYLGGERSGGKRGRGVFGKTPFVAAVETTDEGKPVRLKLRCVTSFCAASIAGFAKRSLDPNCSSSAMASVFAACDAGCAQGVRGWGKGGEKGKGGKKERKGREEREERREEGEGGKGKGGGKVFDPSSFGYRKGRKTADALGKIWREVGAGSEWIVDADLKDYFGSVDHEKLMTLVGKQVADGRVLKLI